MSKQLATRLLLTTVLAGLLASLAFPWLRPAQFLATEWNQELKTLPDEQLLLRLKQLAAIGEDGLLVVAQALNDERPAVAATAHRVLQEQLDRWQTLGLGESSPRVAVLARVLADTSGTFEAEARRAAADLATRILLWPVDRSRVDGAQLVLHCDTVLRTTQANSADPPAAASETAAVNTDSPLRRDYQAGLSGIEQAVLPGGDLPIEIAGAFSPPRLETTPSLPPGDGLPQLFRPPAPPILEAVPTASRPEPVLGEHDSAAPQQPATLEPSLPMGDRLISVPAAQPPLNTLTDVQVMQKLQDPNETLAHAAGDELQRRGFQAVHVAVARNLYDPDPQVRAKLIETLPRIHGIDARPWLIELSRDAEPAVRRRAVAVIATSQDPDLLQRLHEIEREESDPETLRLVRRLLDPERHLKAR